MKNCPKCDESHEKPGTFCSRPCANSRTWTDEQKAERSLIGKKTYENFTDEQKQLRLEGLLRGQTVARDNHLKRIMSTPTEELGDDARRKRVIIEQDFKCNKCTLTHWLDQPMIFELEHKDGNHANNKRENLEALCPNCHSFSPFWRGRKNSSVSVRNASLKKLREENIIDL